MNQKLQEKFTKYEIARIIGARALQIAMDAPVLLKLTEEEKFVSNRGNSIFSKTVCALILIP